MKGQSYVETLLVLPMLLLLIIGVIWFGQLAYAKLATEAAVWSGTRHAIATLNPERGPAQAFIAARYTLSGFGLNPSSAQMTFTAFGTWGRGTVVKMEVCYNVSPPPLPYAEIFFPTRICSRQTMPIYRWKAKW
jgi:Flp pilus assembly protein TadG